MINADSISFVSNARFTSQFKRPLYQSYAYSQIPNTVIKLLTGEKLVALPDKAVEGKWGKWDIVVLFLIDGFGWRFFQEYLSDFPFLSRFESQGQASMISSQFPSTTSAHVSTICTGLEVGQTGFYEWFQYEPLVDLMISPLLFSVAGDRQPNTLKEKNVLGEDIFPLPTLFQSLQKHKVQSHIIQQENIIYTPYSLAMFKGASLTPYSSFRSGLEKAVEICHADAPHPLYLFVYFGDIDAAGHRHGTKSKEFKDAVSSCWRAMEECYWQPIQKCKKKIATLITADHGMAPVDPRSTIYLNKQFPDLLKDLQVNRDKLPLVPAGSCRDFFLHIKEERLSHVHRFLSEELKGKAEVYLVSDLIDRGFFGVLPVSKRFRDRVGNLVILPYHGESVWWYEKHHFEQNFYAAHGGLTPDEIESIFLFNASGV